jgi:hypothetical protein
MLHSAPYPGKFEPRKEVAFLVFIKAQARDKMKDCKEKMLVPWQIKIRALGSNAFGIHLQVKSLFPREFTTKPCTKRAAVY